MSAIPSARYGYRYFLAYADPSDGARVGWEPPPLADDGSWAPLHAPFWGQTWPAGWVTARCDEGCTAVPGPLCGCGITYMEELPQLAWYMTTIGKAAAVGSDQADRLVITRVEVRGDVVAQRSPSLEKRAGRARIVEAWLPAAGARFISLLENFYGAPVHVGDADGEEWLRRLSPTGIPDIPDPHPGPSPVDLDPVQLIEDGIKLQETFEQTPQVQASIRRARETLRKLRNPWVRLSPGFRVSLRHLPAADRAEELQALVDALRAEFPAFRARTYTDLPGACVDLHVEAKTGTPVAAVARLDGWGHDRLTLTKAAS